MPPNVPQNIPVKEDTYWQWFMRLISRSTRLIGLMFILMLIGLIMIGMYGVYLLFNEILYGANLVIWGLNAVVGPFVIVLRTVMNAMAGG
jgi:hypothetical protein